MPAEPVRARTGRRWKHVLARALPLAGALGLLAVAGAGVAAAAPRPAGAGVDVLVGCAPDGGPCGVFVVLCGTDGRVAQVLGLSAPGSGAGGLVVRVGAPCGVRPSASPSSTPGGPATSAPASPGAPSTAPAPPPGTPPASAPPASSPPGAASPTATAPAASASASARPAGPRAAGPVLVSVSAGPPPSSGRPAPAHRPGAGSASPRARSPEVLLPLSQEPPDPGPGDAGNRWWEVSLVAVLLPAALAAAVPRGASRRH
ncbi:hypothetical protein [Actinacidiphila yanglinensis]|uniref:hypothetical protein n=1 Tax=Actinacidiphila yanglinensis TaxID=310779 RepID=UPI0011B044C3|nr:hypothetical protein [Actinacidiphila yanglinensis]